MNERPKMGWKPIVCYVFAVIFLAYAVYMLVSVVSYMGQMVSAEYISGAGQIIGTFIGYFIQSVCLYLFYTLVLGGIGYLIDVKERGLKPKKASKASNKEIKSVDDAKEEETKEPEAEKKDEKNDEDKSEE